jgi:uncharacterized membrane protein
MSAHINWSSNKIMENFINLNTGLWNRLQFNFILEEDPWKAPATKAEKLKIFAKFALFIFHISSILVYGALFLQLLRPKTFNLDTSISGAIFCLVIFTAPAKYLKIHSNRTQINEILRILPQKVLNTEKLGKGLRIYKIACRIFFIYSSLGLAMILKHSVVGVVHGKRDFIFSLDLPFDAKSDVAFPLILAWMVAVHFTTLYTFVMGEVFVYVLIYITAVEFDKLSEKFGHLQVKMIPDLVNRQNRLIGVRNRLENVFSVTFLLNHVGCILIVCIAAFRISIAQHYSDIVLFQFVFCITIFRIFLQCFFSQMLKDSSERVAEAVYSCGWEDFKEVRVRRALALVMQRSHRSIAFTIWNFSQITMEQFATVS